MKTITSIGIFLLIATISFTQSLEKNFIDENYIQVTGSAELEIAPDEIYVKVVINEKDSRVPLEDVESELFDKLKEIGIDIDKDVAILDAVNNLKRYLLRLSVVSNREYQILVKDAEMLMKIFRGLEDLNISRVSIDRLDHSQMEKFRGEVKISAIKAAKEKAQLLAEAIDQSIGKAIHVEEIENDCPNRYSNSANIIGASSIRYEKKGLPQVEFERIKIQYKIMVKFKLE